MREEVVETDPPVAPWFLEQDLAGFQHPDERGARDSEQIGRLAGAQHGVAGGDGDGETSGQCRYHVVQYVEELVGELDATSVDGHERRTTWGLQCCEQLGKPILGPTG